MLDIKWVRENKEEFDRLLHKRNIQPMSEKVIKLDEDVRHRKTLIQELRESKNKKTSFLESIKDKKGSEFQESKKDILNIKEKLEKLEHELDDDKSLQEILDTLPNLPASDVPDGKDENHNKLIKEWGKINKNLSKSHYELGENLKMMDFTQTAKISGSRFVSLSRDLARLERALVNFMIDIHTKEFGFVEISPPILVKPESMYNVGQLPKFSEDSYVTTDNYRLIPTAEVSLTNMVSNTIIDRLQLPIRYVAHTPCFRSEAGSAGRDTRGMIRMHQFNKVELVTITTPDESETEHQYMLSAAEEILRRLELPYRVMLLCSGDMGFAAQKTYDIEVWLPAQNTYREISSCSNCGNFQARRMKARYKELGSHENILVHTLNGSALPIGRTIVAILENYQNNDQSITIPLALRQYMGGQEKIVPYKEES